MTQRDEEDDLDADDLQELLDAAERRKVDAESKAAFELYELTRKAERISARTGRTFRPRTDFSLIDITSPEYLNRVDDTAPDGSATPHTSTKRSRGRPGFPDSLKAKAREMKAVGKSNNEIAKVLYNTPAPTAAQKRGISTILKNYELGLKKQSQKITAKK